VAPEASALALLGRALAREIDEDLLALLQDRVVARSFEQCEPDCAPLLSRPWSDAEIESAEVEYCRLFIVPQAAAPLACAWLSDDDPNGGAVIAGLVDTLVAAVELELPQDLAVLPRDHIAVLLALAAWLIEHRHPDAGEFVDRMLTPWVGRFSAALTARAESPLYRAFGKFLTAAF